MIKQKLTKNEQKVLDSFDNFDNFDGRATGVFQAIVDVNPEFTENQLKGYVSSLDKKFYIIECEFPNDRVAWQKL